jgi:hypothetical protein
MVERLSHGSLRLIIFSSYQTGAGLPLTKIKFALSGSRSQQPGHIPRVLTRIKASGGFPADMLSIDGVDRLCSRPEGD